MKGYLYAFDDRCEAIFLVTVLERGDICWNRNVGKVPAVTCRAQSALHPTTATTITTSATGIFLTVRWRKALWHRSQRSLRVLQLLIRSRWWLLLLLLKLNNTIVHHHPPNRLFGENVKSLMVGCMEGGKARTPKHKKIETRHLVSQCDVYSHK